MNRRETRKVNREIAAIASLKDSEIDTADVPEITDWRGAVTGKFYRPKPISDPQLQGFVAVPEPATKTGLNIGHLSMTNTGTSSVMYQQITIDQLVGECCRGIDEAWREFARRWQQLIASMALRAARRWGRTSPDLVENLVQDVYVKLFVREYQLLKEFKSPNPDAFIAYLKVVTSNVVSDYFRAQHSMKRGGTVEFDRVLSAMNTSSDEAAELNILLDEINALLKPISSERDRTVFWLYYRLGFTASQIAAIPTINLTVKGVESILSRLKELVKHSMSADVDKHLFGNR